MAATVLTPGVAHAASVEVPVAGRAQVYYARSTQQPPATVLVHEVRRVPGGSVLYYSLGESALAEDRSTMGMYQGSNTNLTAVGCFPAIGGTAAHFLLDPASSTYYSTLCDAAGGTISTKGYGVGPVGGFSVLWQAFPELPADKTSIDVVLSNGALIPDVPVRDGEMTPTAEPVDGGVPLGTGWPVIDLARIAEAPDPGRSTLSLIERTSDLPGEVRKRRSATTETVDLASDVLFAVDSARLSKGAMSRIRAAAQQINKSASSGAITVTGHTDSTGTPSHNVDLSKRRAAAVAAALRPLLTVPGAKLTVAGKGESEPVADNKTAEGRQLNRRVSMSFAVKENS